MKLGSAWLQRDNLDGYAAHLADWNVRLDADADLLFYGCDLAGGDAGQQMLDALHTLTGANVAASTDATGNALLGGDWQLEFELGAIDTQVLFSDELQQDWDGLLATFTVTNANDTGGGSLRQAIIDANTLPGVDTITFNIAGTGVHTINQASSLTITETVTIDATTDDSFAANSNRPAIILDGDNSFTGDGLVLTSSADGSVIRGFVIRDFTGDAIEIQAGSDGNTIAGNYIGSLSAIAQTSLEKATPPTASW